MGLAEGVLERLMLVVGEQLCSAMLCREPVDRGLEASHLSHLMVHV
jgi:hypothetical protein